MADTRFEKLTASIEGMSDAVASWFRRYRPWIFSGLTVASILLIVWARFGFTFQIGRFFAAEPVTVGVLSVDCSPQGNVLTWTRDSRADSNGVERGNEGTKNLTECADYWCWLPSQGFTHQIPADAVPAAYTDTQLQEGVCYQYRVKYQPQLPSNSVYCPLNCNIIPSPTPTPAPTPMASPTPVSLTCAPAEQTIAPGDASFEASGGSGTYAWFVGEDRNVVIGTGATFSTDFSELGTHQVFVLDDQASAAMCEVTVVGPGTPTPTPTTTPVPGQLSLFAEVRNFTDDGSYRASATGRPSQRFQVRAVLDTGGTTVPNVLLKASLPDTLSYVAGTTLIDNQPTAVDAIAGDGIGLGTLSGSQQVTFVAAAKGSGQLPSGTLTSVVPLTAAGDGIGAVSATVTVIIDNAPVVTPVSQVPTGPEDVALLSMMAAAFLTLLYVSYTYTHRYRSREAGSIAKRRDPMDFK